MMAFFYWHKGREVYPEEAKRNREAQEREQKQKGYQQ
jgi:hypothetical protein